ncbi:RasGEF [Desmophyllum pertusum]|uniref:RasGEF n=1 Tax=Desmophyllum pertusum TaxID=174260 RepID=A0A9W9YEI3_9CNID|nr:RasGEF [Desmophyllum pertusum]
MRTRTYVHLIHSLLLKVSSWQKFWAGLVGSSLHFFLPKHRTFGGRDRAAFKKAPDKQVNISEYSVVLLDDPRQPDAFQLTDDAKGNSYKFRVGTKAAALMWYTYVREVTKTKLGYQVPQNLITFEESEEQQS